MPGTPLIRGIIEVALSRTVSLPAFVDARRAYTAGAAYRLPIVETIPKEDGRSDGVLDVEPLMVPSTPRRGIHSVSGELIAMRLNPDNSTVTNIATIAHESVHIAQVFQGADLNAAAARFNYYDDPYERQAFNLERSTIDFIERIGRIDSTPFMSNNPIIRTAGLISALRKEQDRLSGPLKNAIAHVDESGGYDVSQLNLEEIQRLELQIRLLEERLASIEQSEQEREQ